MIVNYKSPAAEEIVLEHEGHSATLNTHHFFCCRNPPTQKNPTQTLQNGTLNYAEASCSSQCKAPFHHTTAVICGLRKMQVFIWVLWCE